MRKEEQSQKTGGIMHELPRKDNNKLIKIEELIIEKISDNNYNKEIEKFKRIMLIEGIRPMILVLNILIRQVMEKKKRKQHLVLLHQCHQLQLQFQLLKIIKDNNANLKGCLSHNLHKITINKIIHLEYFPKGP